MDMSNMKNDDNVVLCVSNSYQKKYYLNSNFEDLPDHIKKELKIMCVLYTEDIGGILSVEFNEVGDLEFNTSFEDGDYFYDEIGSVLKIKQYQNEKRDLLEAIETYYKVMYLGQGFDEEE